ncbi:hypothetical protein J3A83DRAFT_4356044 [Scleroderma citrinum]
MSTSPPNKMMDALRSVAHLKLTENYSPAFGSTQSPTLDAFMGLRPGIVGHAVDRLLGNAWAHDPALTLRIIWHCRSIHDGKGEKELFYRAYGWLYENHPRTAIHNLQYLVTPLCPRPKDKNGRSHRMPHGYWKDLLNILALTNSHLKPLCHPAPTSSTPTPSAAIRFATTYSRLTCKLTENRYRALYIAVSRLFADQLIKDSKTLDTLDALPTDKVKERRDLEFALSLAPKWAPTPGGSHDRITNIASAICMLLNHAHFAWSLPAPFSPLAVSEHTSADLHILRALYQKSILTRARRVLSIPEPLMSLNNWSSILYTRVPALCMNANKTKFFLHDRVRFVKFLVDVEHAKQGISGATMAPHVLVMQAVQLTHQLGCGKKGEVSINKTVREAQRELIATQLRIIDAQWAALISRTREAGTLNNCIAVCDVSGSMGSTFDGLHMGRKTNHVSPIWPAVALSLLIARLAKPPFCNAFITFSSRPSLVVLDPEEARVGLGETVNRMTRADWEMNTDFEAVFLKLILPLAVANHVPQEDMIKRVFVFTDMQFDASQSRCCMYPYESENTAAGWQTNHDVIEQAYKRAGYDMPEIVYWDLSNASVHPGITVPVTGNREGVVMLSGYSAALVKTFMDVDAEEEEGWEVVDDKKAVITPEEFMLKAVGKRSFEPLVVV